MHYVKNKTQLCLPLSDEGGAEERGGGRDNNNYPSESSYDDPPPLTRGGYGVKFNPFACLVKGKAL